MDQKRSILSEYIEFEDNNEWLKKEAYRISKEKALRAASALQGDKFDLMR